MKLTKLLILSLGLMALTAATSFAAASFHSSTGYRIIARNSETGETSTVLLTSMHGTPSDPAWVPAGHSFFLTYSVPISCLQDIFVYLNLPSEPDAWMNGTMTNYNQWVPIDVGGSGPTIAQVRVGLQSGQSEYYILEFQFLVPTLFYEGNTIAIYGVRVNTVPFNGMVAGSTVTMDVTNTEGDITLSNNQDLVVAVLQDPIGCDDCSPDITFRSDGRSLVNIATLPISENFTNAFEIPTQIQISIGTLPAGFVFDGIQGNQGSASASWSCIGQVCTFTITSQDEGLLEDLQIGLRFDLTGIPPGGTIPDVPITISLVPTGPPAAYPWSKLKYAYMPITCYVGFVVVEKEGGRLLSVFNTWYDGIWDTGIAIMNGSGAEPLDEYREWWGHWWDIPQYGTVTVYMYPQDTALTNNPAAPTTPFVFTTSATMAPGLGLDPFGRVPPMGEWTALVSEFLLYAVNAQSQLHTGPFTGFIIFECNFPLAEGDNYVTDWLTQSQGYPMINLTLREEDERRGRHGR